MTHFAALSDLDLRNAYIDALVAQNEGEQTAIWAIFTSRHAAGAVRIVTSFVYPPIPVRQFDWCAYRDGREEDGNYGYGRTEAEAIADLLDNEEMMGLDLAADEGAYYDSFGLDVEALLRADIEGAYEDERRRKNPRSHLDGYDYAAMNEANLDKPRRTRPE